VSIDLREFAEETQIFVPNASIFERLGVASD
jgi:hypothetical protein